jgi:hypothetical protein
MHYAIVENGMVVNVAVSEEALEANWIASEDAAIGDLYADGVFSKPVPPALSPEELAAQRFTEVQEMVQKRLDDFAKTRGYDGILSACTYASSQVPKFQTEGQYAVNARDSSWAMCYVILADVQDGIRPLPTVAEVEAELPALVWPQ